MLAVLLFGVTIHGSILLVFGLLLLGVFSFVGFLAMNAAGKRLFIAATTNHSVEVIDLGTDKVEQSITGLGKPHGLASS